MARVASVAESRNDARRTHERIARWYDLIEAPFERRALIVGLQLLDAQAGERILEVGSGTGHVLARLAQQVGSHGSLVGVDVAWDMLEVARRRLRRRRPPLPVEPALVEADATALPLANGRFDAVISTFVLDLVATQDIPLVVSEWRRVMRPSARLVVVSLNLSGRPGWPMRVFLAAHRRFPHLVDCRPLPLRAVLEDNGFVVDGVREWTMWGLPVAAVRASVAT